MQKRKHVEFAYSNAPEYIYRINADGYWTAYKDTTTQVTLKTKLGTASFFNQAEVI